MEKLTVTRMLNFIKDEGYSIEFVRWAGKNYRFYGECDTENSVIRLNYNRIKKLPATTRRVTMLHEIMHAILNKMSAPQGEDLFSEEDEEVVVDALAVEVEKRASRKQKEKIDAIIDSALEKAERKGF